MPSLLLLKPQVTRAAVIFAVVGAATRFAPMLVSGFLAVKF
jgi:hypothetical protein